MGVARKYSAYNSEKHKICVFSLRPEINWQENYALKFNGEDKEKWYSLSVKSEEMGKN